MVNDRGIEVDPSQIKAILDMLPLKSEKEIRGFLGRLQYISRFIVKLTSTCEPIFKLLRKNEPHAWNDKCQKAFELIKEYLLRPPILVPQRPGKPPLLYLWIIENAVGSMLTKEEYDKNERGLYYLSKRFHDYETRYTPIEKARKTIKEASCQIFVSKTLQKEKMVKKISQMRMFWISN